MNIPDGADSLWDRPRQPPVSDPEPSVAAPGAGRHRGVPEPGPDVEPAPSGEAPATDRHRDSRAAHRCAAMPESWRGPRSGAGRAGLRRALLLIGMTLVLPGSAQLYAGSKAIGRAAMRALVLIVIAAGVIWWRLGRNGIVVWSLHPAVLSAVEATLVVLGLCWAALLVDAWRLAGCAGCAPFTSAQRGPRGRPDRRDRGPVRLRSAVGGRNGTSSPRSSSPPVAQTYQGRLNIAILGGDGGLDRSGIRTDQDAVVSIDIHTGRALLISIPRNMEYAQFPPGTPMAEKFPNGFPQYFYGIYTYGSQHPELFPGVDNPGALRHGVRYGPDAGDPHPLLRDADPAGLREPDRLARRADDPGHPAIADRWGTSDRCVRPARRRVPGGQAQPHPRLDRTGPAEAGRLSRALVRPVAVVHHRLRPDVARALRAQRDPQADGLVGSSRTTRRWCLRRRTSSRPT